MNAMIGKRWLIGLLTAVGLFGLALNLTGTSQASGEHIIYTDALASGWQSWSWGGDYTFDSADTVQSGGQAIAIDYTSAWAGLYLAYPNHLNATQYSALHFWAHGGGTGNQIVVVNGVDDSGTWVGSTTINLTADTWVKYEIPLTSLGNPVLLSGIVFQEGAGWGQPVYYLDSIELVSSNAPVATPTPPPSGTGEETLTVDITNAQHTISDGIYGMNFADQSVATELEIGVNRWGGNAVSRYNYQLDVSNRASDWYFLNVPNDVANIGALPAGSSADNFISANRSAGSATMMTMPLVGYTPNGRDWECGYPRSQYPNQDGWDPYRPNCGNGQLNGADLAGTPSNTSNAIDETWVTGWINHLTSQFGTAAQGGVQFYSLDNEPMLWHHTHRDVHPEPVSYDEIVGLSQTYGAAIKSADPSAATVGPAVWGWTAYFYSALDSANNDWASPDDANAHGGLGFLEYYLQQMAAYEAANGTRILDYLDLHFYPQSTGVALTTAGNQATQELRLRSTRALWDPTYIDESWIGEQIQLIPRMNDWVDTRYPNTKLSISEYNFGGVEHINGAVTQAEVLGIFGREGLDMAMMWDPPSNGQPAMYAFRMYRNYDGNGSQFGDISLGAASSNQDDLSIFAARRSSDNAITVMVVNKSFETQSANLALTGLNGQSAEIYQYSSADLGNIARLNDATVADSELTVSLPAQSFMLVVIDAPAPIATGNDHAYTETTLAGVPYDGDFGSTWAYDGTVQRVQEDDSGSLEHQWVFNVLSGGAVLYLNAYVEDSAESEQFTFEYSTNGTDYTPMLQVGGTQRNATQNFVMPDNVSGTIYVRAVDSARAPDLTLNTLAIDFMEFQSESNPLAVNLQGQSTQQQTLNLWIVTALLLGLTIVTVQRKRWGYVPVPANIR